MLLEGSHPWGFYFIPVFCVPYLVQNFRLILSTTYLTFQPRWSHPIHFSYLWAILVNFFLVKHARKSGGNTWLLPFFLCCHCWEHSGNSVFDILSVFQDLTFEHDLLWFFISVFVMVLTTCYICLFWCLCLPRYNLCWGKGSCRTLLFPAFCSYVIVAHFLCIWLVIGISNNPLCIVVWSVF